MAKAIFGNHSSVLVPRQDRESIRRFYCDALGGEVTKADPERDFIRLGENIYIAFLYGDVPDESAFLQAARSVWLEIKSNTVEEMTRKILDFGVRKLEVPDLHLYFQAPGGQCLRLVGIDEDLSFYEGAGEARTWQRLKRLSGENNGNECPGRPGRADAGASCAQDAGAWRMSCTRLRSQCSR